MTIHYSLCSYHKNKSKSLQDCFQKEGSACHQTLVKVISKYISHIRSQVALRLSCDGFASGTPLHQINSFIVRMNNLNLRDPHCQPSSRKPTALPAEPQSPLELAEWTEHVWMRSGLLLANSVNKLRLTTSRDRNRLSAEWRDGRGKREAKKTNNDIRPLRGAVLFRLLYVALTSISGASRGSISSSTNTHASSGVSEY